MEGFLDIKLPVWQRVLITRSIAIVPAVMVTFMSQSSLLKLDNLINVSQAVLLPFALIPTLKLVGNQKIMAEFTSSGCPFWFAVVFGVALCALNFSLLFVSDLDLAVWAWILLIAFILAYLYLMYKVVAEPVGELQTLTIDE